MSSHATLRIGGLLAGVLLGCLALTTAAGASPLAGRPSSPVAISELSRSCPASSSEVEEAVDPKIGAVFADWIGCDRQSIAFVRSTDGGRHFSKPVLLAGSVNQVVWDPAVSVGPTGTLYVSFMIAAGGYTYPIVEVSFDHGVTFARVARLIPPNTGNWGDRDFVAAGAGGTVYVTWDFGPSAAAVKFLCPGGGSCSFAAGDLNIVVQKSTNFGRTWGPMVHVSPGYPNSGADMAPLLVQSSGRVDAVFQEHSITNRKTDQLGPAHLYFTSSTDGGAHWSRRVLLGPPGLTISDQEWWINGAIGIDAAGNLYATWDTQGAEDIGWLSYSSDHGATWSKPVRVTPDHDSAVHIVEVVGGAAGEADVGWQTDAPARGYALYLRPFSISKGWLSASVRASGAEYGNPAEWPGDTFGISYLPTTGGPSAHQHIHVTWGSGIHSRTQARDDIYATTVSLAS